MPNDKAKKGWYSDILIILFGLLIFYALWIGSYPLFTPDEGRYSEVAREMTVSGDYITPRLNGIAFLDKPILYYWLQAIAINIFGLKEWALRLWPASIGIFGSLMVYIAGRTLYNRRTGILSCVILATSPLYYGASHYANLDLEVAVFISNALLFFIISTKISAKQTKTCFMLLAYFFAGLATLTKGLIGIAFPILIIGSWIFILNRWKMLTQMHLIKGLLLYAFIVIPWFLMVQHANPQFFEYFFVLQQVSRFLTKADFNNQTHAWFYIPILLVGFLPWSYFLLQSLTQQIKCVWQEKQKHATELFIVLWFFIIFIFFSIPKSKTIGYVLPTLPAIALMTGHYLDKNWDSFHKLTIKIGAAFSSITFLILAFLLASKPNYFLASINHDLLTKMKIAAIILCVGSFFPWLFQTTRTMKIFFISASVTISFLMLSVISSASLFNHKSIKNFASIIQEKAKPDDEIVIYYRYFQDLPLYLQKRVTIVANWHDTGIEKYDNWQRELWYHKQHTKNNSDWLIENPALLERWNGNKRILLIISNDFYNFFTIVLNQYTHNKANVYLIATTFFNDRETLMLVSNKK